MLGPNAMPAPSPTKTEPNITPYAALPPPRLEAKIFPAPITAPPAVKAPTSPMMSPPTSREWRTKLAPSRSKASRLGWSSAGRRVRRPLISGMNRTINAPTRNVAALK